MKTTLKQRYFGIALLLSFIIAITMHFPLVLYTLFDEIDRHGRERFDVAFEAFDLIGTFIVAFLLFTLNYYLIKPFERQHKVKRKTLALSVFLTIVSVVLLISIINHLKIQVAPPSDFRGHHDELLFRNLFSAAIVLGSIFIMRLIYQKQTFELENEKLRIESLQSQFESLKNQVSPHFLFNSLTALKTLIRESPQLAGQYVDHLSQVLRYTLQGNDKQLVTLREEMEFAESYLFLIKMRYDANLIIHTEIKEEQMRLMLPPLTIQTLLENAVKHNEISKRNPLSIHIISSANETLTVTNRIQKKLSPEQGTGIGLTNLSKQFQLLGDRALQVSSENNEFRIEIPLIKPRII
jgi:sensor histidine kinase YesM